MRARVLALLLSASTLGCAGTRNAPNVEPPLALGEAIADRFIARTPAKRLRFDWGPAVLLYGLQQLADVARPDRAAAYREYIAAYHRHHASPRVTRPDRCAPALSAVPDGASTIAAVHAYLRAEPRNHLGAIDHLGYDSALAAAYPQSIWVDSLVMYGLAAAVVAEAREDPHLLDFAFAQPRIFAMRLQDPHTGLFRHAYLVQRERTRPRGEVFWARGNGWAALAIVDMLDRMPPEHDERATLERIFVHLMTALVANRRDDAQWSTVIGDDDTYAEPSATLLIAYALARGVHLGLLPAEHHDVAEQAYHAVVAELDYPHMRGISRATIPARGRAGYAMVPRGTDLTYGIGALLLAASAI